MSVCYVAECDQCGYTRTIPDEDDACDLAYQHENDHPGHICGITVRGWLTSP